MQEVIELDPDRFISVVDNTTRTTSLLVAEAFGKKHFHILRNIENLDCSHEFSASNFGCAKYLDRQGKERSSYEMTKDGFIFLVMGFTGKKAAKIKEAYINAFNKMAEQLEKDSAGPQGHDLGIADRVIKAERVFRSYIRAIKTAQTVSSDVTQEANDFVLKATGIDLLSNMPDHLIEPAGHRGAVQQRYVPPGWAQKISDWLEAKPQLSRVRFRSDEIMEAALGETRPVNEDYMHLAWIMKELGFRKLRFRQGHAQVRGYERLRR